MANPSNKKSAKPSDNKWAVMGGIALNVEYTRKYGFDATGAAKLNAKLVAVPPPSLFQEAVQADIAGRAKRAERPVLPEPGPVSPVLEPVIRSGREITDAEAENKEKIEEQEETKDKELTTLSLIVEEKAGLDYTLDDGVLDVSEGQFDEDGALNHSVSVRSTGCVITFADGSEPIKLRFDQRATDEREEAEDSDNIKEEDVEPEDEEIAEELQTLADEEDHDPVLSLVIPEKAGKAYTLNDGLSPATDGVVDEEGLLVHPVTYGATKATIKFQDDAEPIEMAIEA